MITRKEIGSRLKQVRNEAGLSQEDLGKAFGVSHATISDWEAGKTRIDLEDLQRLCRILGVTILRIMPVEAPVTPDEAQLISHYRRIPNEFKPLFLDTARTYAAHGRRGDDSDSEVDDGDEVEA